MKPDEIKLRVKTYACELIDDIFPSNFLGDKLKKATAKFWMEQNLWRLDNILNQFVNCQGEIDTDMAYQIYSDTIFDADGKFCLDLKNLIGNDTISKYLPDSMILFTRDDLNKILGINHDAGPSTTEQSSM